MIGMGGMYDDPYDVDRSYLNATEAMEHCPVGATDTVSVYYPDMSSNEDDVEIPNDLENRLHNYIISGNCKMVSDTVTDILSKNFERGISYASYREIIITLQNFAQRIYEAIPQNVRNGNLSFTDFISDELLDVEHMNQIVVDNYEKLTDYYRKTNKRDLIQNILLYIDDNLHHDISLRDVADMVGITPNYLTQYFKKQRGVNFRYYISHKRVNKAKDLLINTNKTVKSIAALCGYNSSKQFIAMFSKVVGMTPMEYRKQELFQSQNKN